MTEFTNNPEPLPEYREIDFHRLEQPIPDMSALRERKAATGYGHIEIDTANPAFDEPIVDAAALGIAGQAYYTRPNAATGEAVDGIPHYITLRQGVAEKLACINRSLRNPSFDVFFGGPVELYIEDGLRPIALQTRLHDNVFPALLKRNHPGASEEDIRARVKELIAVGSADPLKPSPHATGGAVDVILRYAQPSPQYVPGSEVPMGHIDGATGPEINPDHFENTALNDPGAELFRRNRRAYYAIMTGAAFGEDTGLANNPTEFWHWDYGDQLWALVRNEPSAFYSLAATDSPE